MNFQKNSKKKALISMMALASVFIASFFLYKYTDPEKAFPVKTKRIAQKDASLQGEEFTVTGSSAVKQSKKIAFSNKKVAHKGYAGAVAKSSKDAAKAKPAKNIEQVVLDDSAKKVEVIPAKDGEFQAGASGFKLAKDLSLTAYDIRLGTMGTGMSIFADVELMPVKLDKDWTAKTRVGLGSVQVGSTTALTLDVNELFYFNTQLPSVDTYVGAGLNLPLATNSSLGYNLFAGVEHDVKLFQQDSEKVFAELGVQSFSIDGKSNAGLSIQVGYKASF